MQSYRHHPPLDLQRLAERYVLAPMFAAAAALCLALMCVALIDGIWVAALVFAVPAFMLGCAAGAAAL